MKKCNWQTVDAASNDGAGRLPAGGYVARITNVEDVPSREYLYIEYDIAEGEYAGHYANATDRPYLHRFVKGYGDKAMPFFKQFLEALQFSNPGRFDWARWMERSDEREFIGLEIGIVVQDEQYTNTKGEDKTRQNVEGIYATQDIRNGEFRVPEPKDSREKVGAPQASTSTTAGAYDDVPF